MLFADRLEKAGSQSAERGPNAAERQIHHRNRNYLRHSAVQGVELWLVG